ncbi:MAG: hypothetical protein J6B62_05115, partial [Bacteroidales bacterium]|nr:hypothetical protein [Bacteroidales bacterium]
MLETLDCSSTGIAGLNISANNRLDRLTCRSNTKLTLLVIGDSNSLESIDCSSTSITVLDVSKCPSLQRLDCSNTKIISLDLSSNYALHSVNADGCPFESIRFGSIPLIKSLSLSLYNTAGIEISGEFLTSVEIKSQSVGAYVGSCGVSGCPNLERFKINTNTNRYNLFGLKRLSTIYIDNRTTSVSVSVNIEGTGAIESFTFLGDNNKTILNPIDFSENPKLKVLKVNSVGQMKELNISGLDSLEELHLSGKYSTSVDTFLPAVITSPVLKNVTLGGCSNTTFDLSACRSLEHLEISDASALSEIKLPDASSLKSISISNGVDNLSTLDLSGQTELETLKFEQTILPDCLDLSNNLKLRSLILSNIKNGKKIDMGNNPYFREVNIQSNSSCSGSEISISGKYITKISCTYFFPEVSECPSLQSLTISGAKGISLDVSKNPDLQSLTCSSIGLRELNVTGCRKLQSLQCSGNELVTLDVSTNSMLTSLNCSAMPTLQTLYLSRDQSIQYITYDRKTTYIPETTTI